MTTLLCRVGGTAAAVRAIASTSSAEFPCRPVAVRTATGVQVTMLLDDADVAQLRASRDDIEIEVVEDVDRAATRARALVSPGGRYAVRSDVPRGLGRKE